MTLLIKKYSQGSGLVPVLLIHGWAMNNHVFQPLITALPERSFYGLDLPGHGSNIDIDLGGDLGVWSKQAIDALEHSDINQCHLLGWSLGGMLATHLAQSLGERCKSLTLIASNPKFIQNDNWQHAMPLTYLQRFMQNLQEDKQQVVREFMELQVRGAQHAQTALAQVLQLVEQGGLAGEQGLQHGLSILKNADVRQILGHLLCPVNFILGKRDTLVPVAVADDLQVLQAQADLAILPKSGHAPFISHTQACTDLLVRFWAKSE